MVATTTILWFGGQRLQEAPGMPAILGGVLSIAIRNVRGTSALPARSVAKYVNVVTPSAPMRTEARVANVPPPVWAPASEYVMASRPEPPALSAAESVTVTSSRFHPFAFGGS